MITDDAASLKDLNFIVDWQSITVEHTAGIQAFWLREGALVDDGQVQQRVTQVVLHAQDHAGAVVAVCTAFEADIRRLGQPMYFYRAYVTAPWRKHGIAFSMLQRAQRCLADYARSHDFPCIGIALEIQSRELGEKGNQPFWPRTRFSYIGQNANGRRLFVHYFDDATLKA